MFNNYNNIKDINNLFINKYTLKPFFLKNAMTSVIIAIQY